MAVVVGIGFGAVLSGCQLRPSAKYEAYGCQIANSHIMTCPTPEAMLVALEDYMDGDMAKGGLLGIDSLQFQPPGVPAPLNVLKYAVDGALRPYIIADELTEGAKTILRSIATNYDHYDIVVRVSGGNQARIRVDNHVGVVGDVVTRGGNYGNLHYWVSRYVDFLSQVDGRLTIREQAVSLPSGGRSMGM